MSTRARATSQASARRGARSPRPDGSFLELTAQDLLKPVIMAIHEDTPLPEVARIFSGQGISGAPVVDANQRLVGVVSLRDLARSARSMVRGQASSASADEFYGATQAMTVRDATARVGRSVPRRRTAADVMTHKIHSVPLGASITHVAGTMVERGIHRVLVESRGRLAGILSSSDILAALARQGSARRR